jgi:hypothetical protein
MPGGRQDSGTLRHTMSVDPWPLERWTAVIVLLALAFLILIRMGFRGLSVLDARVSL